MKTEYEKFFERAERDSLGFEPASERSLATVQISHDSLFHLPFLAIAVLSLVTDRKYKMCVGESGRFVGLVIERSISGYLKSAQMLGASATLRIRTNEAVVALEELGLIEISEEEKLVTLTVPGRAFTLAVSKEASSLGMFCRSMIRHYRNLRDELGGQL